jgi:hypothetical protein
VNSARSGSGFSSATSALAMGVAIRYKTDGQEMERVGLTYLLHEGDGGWKFALMARHDTDKVAPSNYLSVRALRPVSGLPLRHNSLTLFE